MRFKSSRSFLSITAILLLTVACTAAPAPTPTSAPKAAPPPAATTAPAAPAPKPAATPAVVAPTAAPKAVAPAKPKALTKLKVAYTAISANQLPVWIANEQKLFQKYGLDVELVYVASSTTVMNAMVAGEIPITYGVTAVPLVSANLAGSDVVIIAGIYNTVIQYIMVSPNIQQPADLKGKALGVSRFGSLTDVTVRFALDKWGLVPDKDVAVLQMGGVPEILSGMQTGAIAGGPLSSPTDLKAREAGFKELMDVGAAGFEYPSTTVASTRRFLRDNGPTALNFLRAIVEATYLYKTDKELSMKVLGQYTKTEDRAMLENTYKAYAGPAAKIPYLTKQALQAGIDEVAKTNDKAKDAKPDVFVDWQFVKQLEDSGFIKQTYKE
ncbi:MAG: ABC transporter substrate-binding protein [Chloroflexi bacterium]|nr:ABC transporter substrate-binding protein [Chloroflexota bacterium]